MTNDPSADRFELAITVKPEDIDQLDHVNNTVYLRWVQEAAIAHWTSSATQEEQRTVAWVVVRHEIDYTASARKGDTVIARTWVGTTVKNYFERHTEIFRERDMKLLARARTLWCPVDIGTGRPMRVSKEIIRRFSVHPSTSQP